MYLHRNTLLTMYVLTTQAASLLQISSRRLRTLLQKGRVVGAYKSGKVLVRVPLRLTPTRGRTAFG